MGIQNNKSSSHDGELPMQPKQTRENPEPPIDVLPPELITHIFSFLDIHELAKVSLVKREWHQIASHNGLWKEIAYRLELRGLNNEICCKSLISEMDLWLHESLSKFGAIVPDHLIQKPTTISKLQNLFAWHFTLADTNTSPCLKRFENNDPHNIRLYLTFTLDLLKSFNNKVKLLAEFVISHNIIDIWRQIAQKADIHINIDRKLLEQPDSKHVNSLFNQWIDDNLEAVHKIETLKLNRLGLIMLPDELQRLKNLKGLDLSENSLYLLPPWIGSLTKLEHLFVNMNKLFFLPHSLRELKTLKELRLDKNNFTKLPGVVKDLTNLKVLDFGFTQITETIDHIKDI